MKKASGSVIENIRVRELHAPLLQPFRIALGEHRELDNLLVELRLKDGSIGCGEAAIASHITGETVEETRRNILKAAGRLRGRSAGEYLRIVQELHEAFPRNKAAVAALETALLDALMRRLRLPLWKLFGSKAERLTTDITIVIGSLEETQEKTREFHRAGFRAFKIKVGGPDMDLDFQRVAAVARFAPRSKILLDANQGYDARQALKFIRRLEKAGIRIDLLEQPVPKKDIEGLAQVTRGSKVLVCADESASSMPDVVELIKKRAVGAVNIKLMKTGLIHGFEIARLSRASGMKLMIGGMMESNLAMTAAAHLAAACGYFDFIDLDTPFFVKGEARKNPYLSARGVYDLRKVRAGIGLWCQGS